MRVTILVAIVLAVGISAAPAPEPQHTEESVPTYYITTEQKEALMKVEKMLRRDRRGIQVISSLLHPGTAGGGGPPAAGVEASASAGSDSGSLLNLVGPLVGSSSGTPGGDGDINEDGSAAGGGSDSGSILSLAGPVLSASSATGESGGSSGAGGDDDGSGASGGSDSGSILSLVGPLLGSSSGGSSGGDGSASGGSDSGAIFNLVGPLLGSSSSGSSGGGGSGGNQDGSGLGSILSISSSSKGHGAIDQNGVVHGGGVISSIKGAKIALVTDKIQLLLRLKYGIISKLLNKITGVIAKVSLPPEGFELKYPTH